MILSKKRRHEVVMSTISSLIMIIFMIFGLAGILHARSEVHSHMIQISAYQPLTSSRNSTEVVWYNPNCRHCQSVIPNNYVINKLTFHHVQYRAITGRYNNWLHTNIDDPNVPNEFSIKDYHGQYNAVQRPLLTWFSVRTIAFICLYLLIIGLISWTLTWLVAHMIDKYLS